MKPVKTFVSVAVLVFAFAIHAPAGEQQTPGAVPTPTPTNATSTFTGTVDAPSLDDSYYEQSGETVDTSDYLLFEAFAALLSLY